MSNPWLKKNPTVPTTSGAADTSVPEAGAVPLPGQNNDHSAPLTPADPASKP